MAVFLDNILVYSHSEGTLHISLASIGALMSLYILL